MYDYLLTLVLCTFFLFLWSYLLKNVGTQRENGLNQPQIIGTQNILDIDGRRQESTLPARHGLLTMRESMETDQQDGDLTEESEESEQTSTDLDEESSNTEEDLLVNKEKNVFRSCVDSDKLAKEIQMHRTLHGMIRYLEDNIVEWKSKIFNIAITGNSGVGKSSLINTLRDLKPRDNGAARVGVTETTLTEKQYMYPRNDRVILTDLPGMGTLRFPRRKYLKHIDYGKFDIFIIVFTGRVLENDIWLARKLLSKQKHVMFVRTKLDVDMANHERDYPNEFDEQFKINEIKKDIIKNLKDGSLNLKTDVYAISSVDRSLYDFESMDTRLRQLLNKKAKSICKLILCEVTKDIEQKKSEFKGSFFWRNIAGALTAFLPDNVDVFFSNNVLNERHKLCLERFCLDDKSLKRIDEKILAKIKQTQNEFEFQKFILHEQEQHFISPMSRLLLSIPVMIRNVAHLHGNTYTMCDLMAKCETVLISEILKQYEVQMQPLQQLR